MVLTDTPGTGCSIKLDIVGSLPTMESGHSYIFTIQDLLTKYLVAILLKQATLSEIAEALVEGFINPYTAPKAWIIDQGSYFINKVMRHVAL